MAATERPVIGITGPRKGAVGPRFCLELAIRLAGGIPLQLRPGDVPPEATLDGVVISGGHDVEPVLYKAAAEVVGNYDPERDRFEADMIDHALAAGLPLLGVCRGAQLLNVCLGGDLFQDLKYRRNHTAGKRSILPVKRVRVEHHSLLADILGRTRLKVNSLHNQGIDRLGVGLEVAARDRDDIVQAVEDPRRPFVIGVQWHPEFLLYLGNSRQLFRRLVAAARGNQRS